MSYQKNILYIGLDDKFYHQINNLFIEALHLDKNESNFDKIMKIAYPSNKWFFAFANILKSNTPQLIYFDFSTLKKDQVEIFFLHWSLLFHHDDFKCIPFIGLFKDKEQLIASQCYFAYGVVYSFIKYKSVQTLFNDTYYIAYEEAFVASQFAKLSKINLPVQVGLTAIVSILNEDNISVECDFDAGYESDLSVNLNLFSDVRIHDLAILDIRKSELYKQLFSYTLEVPYPGPWEENNDRYLDRASVETWIDLNIEDMILHSLDTILIFNSDKNFLIELSSITPQYKELSIVNREIDIQKEGQDLEKTFAVIKSLKPKVIFLEINEEQESHDALTQLSHILNYIKKIIDYQPIICFFKSKSTSIALQKLFDYSKIIALPLSMNISECKKLINIYQDKKNKNKLKSKQYTFLNNSIEKFAEVIFDVTISSMTEHEIIFYSKHDIPLFSTLHFNIPVSFFLTIVPHYYSPPSDLAGTSYFAFINGVSQDDLKIIRRFINQGIKKPLLSFDTELKGIVIDDLSKSSEVIDKHCKMLPLDKIVKDEKFKRNTNRKSKL